MCLYTTQKEPKIADKDIICYKVLEICNPEWESESGRKRKKPVLRSVYYPDFKWNIDKLYRSRLVIQPSHLTDNYPVAKAFHSYETLESAKSYYQATFVQPCVIVRCIIPKGAKYCEGMHSDKQDGFASNKIIMKGIVDLKELYPEFDSDKYPYKRGQLLFVSCPEFPYGTTVRVTNIIPLGCDTVRLRVGFTYYDTDINGIPVLATEKIQVYNDKETK